MRYEGDRESVCSSCGALIIFAQHSMTRRWLPFDATPATYRVRGLYAIVDGFAIAEHHIEQSVGVDYFVPHWATCDDPDRHRRIRRDARQ